MTQLDDLFDEIERESSGRKAPVDAFDATMDEIADEHMFSIRQGTPEFSLDRLASQAGRSVAQGAGSAAQAFGAQIGGMADSAQRNAAAPTGAPGQPETMARYFARLSESDKAEWGEIAAELPEDQQRPAMYKFIQDKLRSDQKAADTFAKDMPEFLPGDPEGVGGLVEKAVKAVGPTAIPMAMNFIPGMQPAATGAIFQTMYGQSYDKYEKQGKDPQVARDAALLNALPATAIEQGSNMLQVGAMKDLVGPFAKSVSGKVLKWAMAVPQLVLPEVGEEVSQSYWEAAADVYADNPGGSVEDWTAEYKKRLPETKASAKEAAKVAGVAGLMLGGAAAGVKGAVTGYNKLAAKEDARVDATADVVGDLESMMDKIAEEAKIPSDKPEFLGGEESAMPEQTPPAGPDTPEFLGGRDVPVQETSPVQEKRTERSVENDMESAADESRTGAKAQIKGTATSTYAPRPQSPYGIQLPEAVEMVKQLNEGKVPKVVKDARARGRFEYDAESSDIVLRPDLAIGDRINSAAVRPKKSKAQDKATARAEEAADIDQKFVDFQDRTKQSVKIDPASLVFTKEYNRKTGETDFFAYRKDPTVATKTLMHELGHWDQWFPGMAKIKGKLPNFISKITGGVANAMPNSTAAERVKIKEELKALTKEWKPFDDKQNEDYTAYRYGDKELYADAVSVMMNDPELLRQTAPTFARAMDNYATERPEFSEAINDVLNLYAGGPDAVGDRRLANQVEGFERGDTALREAQKAGLRPPKEIADTLFTALIDKNRQMLKHVAKMEKSSDPDVVKRARKARTDLEEVQYIASEVSNYINASLKEVVEPLLKLGVDVKQFGSYLLNRHIIENRKDIFSPGGLDAKTAQGVLDALKRQIGDAKYNKLEDLSKAYRKIREELVLPRIAKSGMTTPAVMDILNSRGEYAKVSYVKHITVEHGAGVAGRIFHQIGGLDEAMNPLTATIMQDMSLLRAAHINKAKTSMVDALMDAGVIEPAKETTYNPITKRREAKDPKDETKGLLTVMRDGKPFDYIVNKEISDSFKWNPVEATKAAEVIGLLHRPLRDLLVSKNPIWMIRNVMRDVRATIKNLPEARIKNLPKLARAYKKAYGEAWRDVWHSDRSQDIKDMMAGKMLTAERVFGTKEQNSDNEIMRLKEEWGVVFDPGVNEQATGPAKIWQKLKRGIHKMEQSENRVIRKIKYGNLDKWGRVSEIGGKIAGYKFLKEMGTRADSEIGHVVRTRVGTPDFKRQGSRNIHALTNNIFLFSNVNKEGLRSAWESFQEDKSAYIWKTVMYNVLPKLALYAAAEHEYGQKLMPYVKKAMDGLTRYQKTAYSVIPLPWTYKGSSSLGNSMALLIPEDYEGQFWGSVFYKLVEGVTDDLPGIGAAGVAKDVWGKIPYSTGPYLAAGWDLIQYYLMGNNPVNDHTGGNVLPKDVYEVGGWDAAKEMIKHTSNQLGLSVIHRFQTGDLDKEPDPIKDKLRTFGPNLTTAVFTLTDAGHAERYREAGEAMDKEDKALKLKAKKEITSFINKNGYATKTEDRFPLYDNLRQKGLLPEDYTFKKFETWFRAIQTGGREDERIRALSYASSNKKRGMYLDMFSMEMPPDEFQDFLDQMMQEGFVSGDALAEMHKRQDKER